jgi:hypothetical protein
VGNAKVTDANLEVTYTTKQKSGMRRRMGLTYRTGLVGRIGMRRQGYITMGRGI